MEGFSPKENDNEELLSEERREDIIEESSENSVSEELEPVENIIEKIVQSIVTDGDKEEEPSSEMRIYDEDELIELPDAKLKEICNDLGIEYDEDDFDRDYFISEILYAQGNNDQT